MIVLDITRLTVLLISKKALICGVTVRHQDDAAGNGDRNSDLENTEGKGAARERGSFCFSKRKSRVVQKCACVEMK